MNDNDAKTPNENVQAPSLTPVPDDPIVKDVNKLKSLFSKFNLNRKKLIIVGIVAGIFLVLIILISVISKNIQKVITPKVSPTPTIEVVIPDPLKEASVSGELESSKVNLQDLRTQINDLDVNQSRLKPPSVNFKIDFQPKK